MDESFDSSEHTPRKGVLFWKVKINRREVILKRHWLCFRTQFITQNLKMLLRFTFIYIVILNSIYHIYSKLTVVKKKKESSLSGAYFALTSQTLQVIFSLYLPSGRTFSSLYYWNTLNFSSMDSRSLTLLLYHVFFVILYPKRIWYKTQDLSQPDKLSV